MNCRHVEPLLLSARDGTLTAEQRAGIERHLAECAPCRQLQADLNASLAALRAEIAGVTLPDVDAEWRQLQGRLREARPTPARRRRSAPLLWFATPLAAAAAIALAFVLARPFPVTEPSGVAIEPSPLANLAHADYVEVALGEATPIVYVDQESGWLVVWADMSDTTHG
ncbi:MAG: zf-HC2 domain-containing protein [Candidatus Didemnitutus sp.]|nr:zf-HC2 domain-containing protein [Candidatus Didemnitutus sp.]